MAFAFVPSNASEVDVAYGIDHIWQNYIIQDEDIQEGADDFRVRDQKGKVAQIHSIQRYWTCSLSMIGPTSSVPVHAGATYQWYVPGSDTALTYYVNRCRLTNTQGDSSKWAVEMECYQSAAYENHIDDSTSTPAGGNP